jgi:hypothetical protein
VSFLILCDVWYVIGRQTWAFFSRAIVVSMHLAIAKDHVILL